MRRRELWSELPGGDLVRQGLEDAEAGVESIAALLVAIGAPRLQRVLGGLPRISIPHPEHRFYELLAREHSDSAHARYNAYLRRLVSFERAAETAAR